MKILIALWLIFFISHSLFAATKVKAFFEKNLKIAPPQYRLLYNAFAVLILVLIVLQLLKTESEMILKHTEFIFGMGCGIAIGSLWLLKLAAKDIHLPSFLGFSAAPESSGLITTGLYKIVRHPLYFSTTVSLIGLFLMFPTVNVAVSIVFSILYIIIGIEFEEKKLRQTFGATYDHFARGKKKFLPFIY